MSKIANNFSIGAYFFEKKYVPLQPKININMYAIVEIAGQQFKIAQGQEIFVHRLDANEGDNVSFDKVLLTEADGLVTVGSPTVSGMTVSATVLGHQKGDKVIIFKKKRRKGYRVKNGHRQQFTKIKIDAIA